MTKFLQSCLLLLFFAAPALGQTAGCGRFDDLATKLQSLVKAEYPDAEFRKEDKSIVFRFDTRKFMVHEANMMGDWQEAFSEEGPNRKGILGEIHIEPGLYQDQAVVPQSWDKRYFTEVLHAPYSKECDSHLHARLWYPPGVKTNFVIRFFQAIDDFGSADNKSRDADPTK